MATERVKGFLKNPRKGLLVLALPIFVSMLVQTLYNVVDTAFVGRLGAEAIAALTFSFPLFFILIAVNAGMGAGVSSRISRFLGEKNKKGAENTAMHGIYIALILGVLVLVLGLLFLRPLLSLFGAKGEVLELSLDYMKVIVMGSFFMFLVGIFSNIFRSQGDTKTGMKIYVFSLILNIILDPIFIFWFDLGVMGAAIASVIAFFFGLLVAIYYIKTKSDLNIGFSSFKYSKKILKEIVYVGFPASLMMFTMSLSVIFINKFLSGFSVEHVAAFGIIFRLESVAILPIVAISLALLPLVGMMFGARKFNELKDISFYGMKIGVIIAVFMGVVLFLLPEILLKIFTNNQLLIELGSAYIRISVFSYPFLVFSMLISRVMQGMGFGMPGFLINLVRGILIPVPLMFLFIFLFGYGYLSVPIALVSGGIVGGLFALVWFNRVLLNCE